MNGPKDNPYFDMNWKTFEQFFGGKLPFTGPNELAGNPAEGMAWVENYVKDIMKQTMPQVETEALKHHLHSELFETHNSIIAKIHIPDRAQARQIRVMVNSSQIRLENLPGDKKQLLKLPSPIVAASCKGVYKNGILQLNMRKHSGESPFREVDIRF